MNYGEILLIVIWTIICLPISSNLPWYLTLFSSSINSKDTKFEVDIGRLMGVKGKKSELCYKSH